MTPACMGKALPHRKRYVDGATGGGDHTFRFLHHTRHCSAQPNWSSHLLCDNVVQSGPCMQDDRAELLAGVHACLLSHLSACRGPGGAVEAPLQARVPLSPLLSLIHISEPTRPY